LIDDRLGIEGFTYPDLYSAARLADLDKEFLKELDESDPNLYAQFANYREARGEGYAARDESNLIVEIAPFLGRFLARLFNVLNEREVAIEEARSLAVIFEFKKQVVQRRVRKLAAESVLEAVSQFPQLNNEVSGLREARTSPAKGMDEELEIAELWQATREDSASVDLLVRWLGALAIVAPHRVTHWVSWKQPQALDYQNLVQIERPVTDLPEHLIGPDRKLRRRDGFKLTDQRFNEREVLDEVHYCLYCHERDKDSCSAGFVEKDGSFRKNPLGIPLAGCPLDEKISEAHLLKRDGDSIAALAVVMIDNPMCPGTGHRICNDCMKACIFQKQEPVNIPQAETGILTDVLDMPWGVEIYDLLTRWNPLNAKRPTVLPYNGKNVLVVGMGPAGYTLAHHLLNEGFGVVGIDGLKIEPLSNELTGGKGAIPRPIRSWSELYHELDERTLEGFGGVSEYGITVRWDKNFLTLIHLVLSRRLMLRIYGGIRFGGTMTIDDAWDYGFDHIAIATGAGRPTIIGMKNNLVRGIRKASDFLMALQLTGAFKASSMANLQAQLPALVIGGGLTAIDTATELAAYYPVQVEKMLERHEAMAASFGEARLWKMYNEEEAAQMERFLAHGRQVRAERARARASSEQPNFVPLIKGWGGVSIVYRRTLIDSPAYRLNHEEVSKALEEGISFIECLSPVEANCDTFGAVASITFERQKVDEHGKLRGSGELITLPARSVCVAAGTSPNVIYEKEYPGTFKLDRWGHFFQGHALSESRELVEVDSTKGEVGFFTSYARDGRFITFYGDNHPVYAGNVVKAMASAKTGFAEITKLFSHETDIAVGETTARIEEFYDLTMRLDDDLIATVVRVDRLTPTIVDVIVRAPSASRHFQPGQFFRLQNFETSATQIHGTRLAMEGLALTGAWSDPTQGLLSLIVLEMGGSSRLCDMLKPGERVVVMGPTGTPTEIPTGETVLLAGGGLGNAVLFSIARALKETGNSVVYFAGYKKRQDLFKREEIESWTDQVIWSIDFGEMIEPHRTQDRCFTGNIVEAMKAYADGVLGKPEFALSTVDRVIAIGSDRMMAAVARARRDGMLASYFKPGHRAIGSINSPMQCMMKEVCAQCLQRHVDPATGKESFVFSCFNQDQLLDEVDFANLSERLLANSVQEKLASLWLDYLLQQHPIPTA
jgi:NADPH-dependent glutamate synthase beta subunit-like oxidoreductase/NAD(P)H-flavin reductase